MSGRDDRSAEDRLIARFFEPIATHPGALGLSDDAAFIKPPAGCDLVLKTDAIVGGVHFFPEDAARSVASKALRVNLSDLAAKGARPLGFLLTLALPKPMIEVRRKPILQHILEGLRAAGATQFLVIVDNEQATAIHLNVPKCLSVSELILARHCRQSLRRVGGERFCRLRLKYRRHSRIGGNPVPGPSQASRQNWIPACAGMTLWILARASERAPPGAVRSRPWIN